MNQPGRTPNHTNESGAPHAQPGFWQRLVLLKPGELAPLLWSAGYFFCVLFGMFMLRPVRDTFGIRGDLSDLPWLWTGTSVAVLLATPLFALLVSRQPRRRFMPWLYHFFAANLLAFYGLLLTSPSEQASTVAGYAFYVWYSVFNLFAVSVFWGFMTDVWTSEQSTRLFGALAVGGTLGATLGSSVPAFLAERIGNTNHLLPMSALMLEFAVLCIWMLVRRFGLHTGAPSAGPLDATTHASQPEPTPNVWSGFVLISRSPYLLAMAAFMLLYTITSTFLYFEQVRIVKETFSDRAAQTAAFGRIDLLTNLLTLVTQILLTGRFVRRLGVGAGLCLIPMLTILGFAALMLAPHVGWPIFITFAVFQALRRSMHHAVDRPTREMLYTPLGPDEKYKSKSFIDTFVYRGGDLLGAWANAIKGFAATVELVAIALGVVWCVVGVFLASKHASLLAQRREQRARL